MATLTILKKSSIAAVGAAFVTLGTMGTAQAALIAFNNAISGATTYSFDGDGDSVNDVIFTTTDPLGFNTRGPGSNMSYIQEPGLEGTSLLPVDLRVDFLAGAKDFLKFGFALNSFFESPNSFASFKVYDKNSNLLASDLEYGRYTNTGFGRSNFPEGLIETSFTGVASYALFNFNSDAGRYIIDNFEGKFGSTEVNQVPEPTSALGLLAFGALGLNSLLKRKQQQQAEDNYLN